MKKVNKSKFSFGGVAVFGFERKKSNTQNVITVIPTFKVKAVIPTLVKVGELQDGIRVKATYADKVTVLKKMYSIGEIIKSNESVAISPKNASEIISIIEQ
jgi:hypothetical protein